EVPQFSPGVLQFAHVALRLVNLRGEFVTPGFDLLEFYAGRLLARKLVVDVAHGRLKLSHLTLDPAQALFGPRLIDAPHVKPEDLAQHRLALARRLLRELVRPALHQEGRVNKRIVVEAQHTPDGILCLADRAPGDRTPALPVLNLEVEFAPPPALARPVTPHLVAVAIHQEGEAHFHLGLIAVDEIVVAAGARLAPQRPRHRVEQ